MNLTFGQCFNRTIELLGRNRYHDEALNLKALLDEESIVTISHIRIFKKMIFVLCNFIASFDERRNGNKYNQKERATNLMNRCVELLEESLANELT